MCACTTARSKPHATSKDYQSLKGHAGRAFELFCYISAHERNNTLSFALHFSDDSMTSGRLLCAVVRATAWSIAVPSVAAFFGVPMTSWISNRNGRWRSSGPVTDHDTSSCRIRARAGATKSPSIRPHRSSLKDTDVTDSGVGVLKDPTVEDTGTGDADVELGEGEELLGTVDVTPEQIAEFFAQPS